MAARLHSLVQHAYHLDQIGMGHAIENDVHRSSDRRFAAFAATMPNMKTSEPRYKVTPLGRRSAKGIKAD
jgi:hypothetical protein